MHTSKHFQDYPEEAPPNFDSTLLVCPAIEGDIPPFPVYQILRYILAPLFHTRTPFFMPEPVTAERIWRDPKLVEHYLDPEKVKTGLDAYGCPFRLGTAVGLLQGMEEGKTSIPDITTPFCIIHGDSDLAVPIAGSKLLFEKSKTPSGDKEFHPISDCYHGVMADPKAEEAMQHLSSFVDSRLKKFVPPKQE
jgi:alpha-beta hydrolase superfamily lysophospholipase